MLLTYIPPLWEYRSLSLGTTPTGSNDQYVYRTVSEPQLPPTPPLSSPPPITESISRLSVTQIRTQTYILYSCCNHTPLSAKLRHSIIQLFNFPLGTH